MKWLIYTFDFDDITIRLDNRKVLIIIFFFFARVQFKNEGAKNWFSFLKRNFQIKYFWLRRKKTIKLWSLV